MTFYVVMVHGPTWDSVIGVTSCVETARHIVHQKQEATEDAELLDCEHVAIHLLDADRFYESGA